MEMFGIMRRDCNLKMKFNINLIVDRWKGRWKLIVGGIGYTTKMSFDM